MVHSDLNSASSKEHQSCAKKSRIEEEMEMKSKIDHDTIDLKEQVVEGNSILPIKKKIVKEHERKHVSSTSLIECI